MLGPNPAEAEADAAAGPRPVRTPRDTTAVARRRRATLAAPLFAAHGGVARRRDLRAAGVGRDDVRAEISAGRWHRVGWHTVASHTGPLTEEARLWRAVWESGSGAALDGVAALCAYGLTGFEMDAVDVTLPHASRSRPTEGVRARRVQQMPPLFPGGVPRVRIEWAVIHAAQWARTDRAAALLMCLPLQQRLVRPDRLLTSWRLVRRSPRRAFLEQVIQDVCDGAQSLGEVDVAALCRRHRLPPPTRQAVCRGPGGRIYLDVQWPEAGLVVEIDGGHHQVALNPVDDALRQNEVTLGSLLVLRIPVLGLRLAPDAFMRQVVRAYVAGRARRLAAAAGGDAAG